MPDKGAKTTRNTAIDALRGMVMMLMVVDHARDFFFGMGVSPTNIARTWPALFFTRWLTHFCAPGFVLLAGVAIYLSMTRKKTEQARRAQRIFLAKRGLFLVVLEITIVRLGWVPDPTYSFTLIQVIWAIGWSMILLAPLTVLNVKIVGAVGLAIVAGHNLFDVIRPEMFGAFDWLWVVLHEKARFEPLPGRIVYVSYAVLPWFGVMASGYGLGALFMQSQDRVKRLALIGSATIALFAIIRLLNGYGNNMPWLESGGDMSQLMSFLNTQKYPPSLAYVCMTVGPLVLLLGAFQQYDIITSTDSTWLQTLAKYGRAPLFFYLAHLFLLRFVSLLIAYLRFGRAAFEPPPGAAGNPNLPLWATWFIAAVTIVALGPACHWFSQYKRQSQRWWVRYV